MTKDGLSMNGDLKYTLSSFRYFAENEHHIARIIPENVLLLGISGVLRFSENGVPTEVRGGEYYIQRGMLHQTGPVPSDMPVYFFIHFHGEWSATPPGLAVSGRYDVENMMPMMKKLAQLEQSGATLIEKNEVLCHILGSLYRLRNRGNESGSTTADIMIRRMTADLTDVPTLRALSGELHFSPNYLIRVFREATGQTPHAYVSDARLRQARLLLETTNATAENVAMSCGFSDYPHFYRMFTRKYGVSPSQYRRTRTDAEHPYPDA